ncbi:MAG: MarR family transcriptional regulator [Actinomycetota bacterium]
MLGRLTEAEQATWQVVMSANTKLLERLDHQLQQRSQLSLTDYEILSGLEKSQDKRLRMSELADRVLVSRSRLTYRIDRLVGVGYVAREECPDDRRGLFAILTPFGSEALRAAMPGHVEDIRGWFIDLLDPGELEVLERVFQRMDEKLAIN